MERSSERIIKVSLPEKLGIEIENYVTNGWFIDESEVLRVALLEFIQHNRFRLMEHFMKEDIEWALKVKMESDVK
ncbi:MAG: CopG family transcriptional regulator [Halobacteriota archaeon]